MYLVYDFHNKYLYTSAYRETRTAAIYSAEWRTDQH